MPLNNKTYLLTDKVILKTLLIVIVTLFAIASKANDLASINIHKPVKKDTVIETVKVKIIPRKRNGIFNNDVIHYRIHITNTYKTAQEGTVVYEVKNDRNKSQLGYSYTVYIPAHSSINIRTKFKVTSPGFYDYMTRVNLSDYDDTIKKVFGYKPTEIITPSHKPADFEKFWDDAKSDLAKVDPKYVIEYVPSKSTRSHIYYNVQMQSLDDVTIHGWVSVPRLPGKYPVVILMPGYNQIIKPYFPDQQAIFSLSVRTNEAVTRKGLNPKGIENKADYCLINLEDKNNYIYRGAYMDCIRAIDFVCSNRNMGFDTSRIITVGGSQGASFSLISAALDKRVSVCSADDPIYSDFHTYFDIAANKTPGEFPYKYLNGYADKSNIKRTTLMQTLDYFDVQNFVPYIKCPCLFVLGMYDPIAPPTCVYSTYNKLNSRTKRKSEINILNTGHEITEQYAYYKFLWIDENSVSVLKN